jgi:hypothetical protein
LGERRSGVVTQVDERGGQRASGRAGWCGYSFGEQVDGVRAISRVGGGELWAEALRPVAGGDVDDGQLSRDRDVSPPDTALDPGQRGLVDGGDGGDLGVTLTQLLEAFLSGG